MEVQQNNQNFNQQRNHRFSTNTFNLQDSTFIRLKLDTSELLTRIESYLSGKKRSIVQNEAGDYVEIVENKGISLANEEGVMQILHKVDIRCNNHTVQGNTDKEELCNFLADARIELTNSIILNCYNWDIKDINIEGIIDDIMSFIHLSLTRTVDNKERESLMQQFISKEVISQNPKKGMVEGLKEGMRL